MILIIKRRKSRVCCMYMYEQKILLSCFMTILCHMLILCWFNFVSLSSVHIIYIHFEKFEQYSFYDRSKALQKALRWSVLWWADNYLLPRFSPIILLKNYSTICYAISELLPRKSTLLLYSWKADSSIVFVLGKRLV